MSTDYNAVPLTTLGLTEDDINYIRENYPQFEHTFTTDTDSNFAIPIDLIKSGYDESPVNTDLLLKVFKHEDITPTELFEYCVDVFRLASKQSPEQQKNAIAAADHYATGIDKQQVRSELNQLETQTDNASFFDILQVNYNQQLKELQKRLKYDETPDPEDVWEINLVNIQGVQETDETKPITVVVEDFIMPDETEANSIFDSPALVRIVGEYDEYTGLEEGDLFVATPAAFADGKYITNLSDA